ncbi:MAG: ATP-binding protein [Bacteroidales bacterium]|nr:ATP-binding protein [Bacteroidales bacterium]
MLRKIAITGPESTGKSWLAGHLAKEFNTVWIPEYAREYLSGKDTAYVLEDVVEIAKGQLAHEHRMIDKANQFLFSDTEMLVCKIWTDFVFNQIPDFIKQAYENQYYDLYLLCDIDLPWEPDPLREHPNSRQIIFDKYKMELTQANLPFAVISGFGENRLKHAINVIHERFSD